MGRRDYCSVKKVGAMSKRRQLTIMGCFWDYHPLFRLFDDMYESKFLSFYPPVLRGEIGKEKIVSLEENSNMLVLWPFKILRRTLHITKQILIFKPDVVVAHHDDANISILPVILFFKILSFKKRPVFILWIRNNPIENHDTGFFSRLVKFSYRNLYKFADNIVVQCQDNYDIVAKHYPTLRRILKVIPNIYDLNKIQALSRVDLSLSLQAIFSKKNFIFITIGRLTKQKGHRNLIRAFAKVSSVYKDVSLLIIGKGELKKDLIDLINDLKIDGKVILLGQQDNPYNILSHSHCFILSSLYEGFPNVIVESLALNIPVISTNCKTGPREILAPNEIIEDKNIHYAKFGILTPSLVDYSDANLKRSIDLSDEENLLAEAMCNLYKSKDLQKKYSSGYQRASDFNINNKNLLSLLEDL